MLHGKSEQPYMTYVELDGGDGPTLAVAYVKGDYNSIRIKLLSIDIEINTMDYNNYP